VKEAVRQMTRHNDGSSACEVQPRQATERGKELIEKGNKYGIDPGLAAEVGWGLIDACAGSRKHECFPYLIDQVSNLYKDRMIELAAGVEDKTERSRVLGFLATQFDNHRMNEHTGEAYPFTTEMRGNY